ncbi:hypothetical protein [Solitalea canadensis]|uniref:Lipoprotein n=1 Tax=Solitalea canadensis (strain ATCC 29591 / DSM 3403 / JCM 21819 / LMG 8368 / NBRC 15130 / NCIMB 12057 / USAM 9D) TaxID=929556 RepID=H8KUJ2_SOLCM|nr:hypothetical protein [Solitalea canadensis]AFD07416.1 hypothetical protein Solca_2375 [Solitalea canadensis DSM 3403]
MIKKLLAITLVIILFAVSCKKDESIESSKSKEHFTIDEAKSWFQSRELNSSSKQIEGKSKKKKVNIL